MNSKPVVELLPFAASVVRHTGSIIRESQQEASRKSRSVTEAIAIVTKGDCDAQQFLLEAIASQYPVDALAGDSARRRWIVEPIEAGMSYVDHTAPSVVSLAVEMDGELALSVVYDTAHDELFAAVKSMGAYLNGAMLPIRLEDIPPESARIRLVGATRRHARLLRGEMANALAPDVQSIGFSRNASLDLCHLAAGRYDAVAAMMLPNERLSAGLLIAEEAGCVQETIETSPPCELDELTLSIAAMSYASHFSDVMRKVLAPKTSATEVVVDLRDMTNAGSDAAGKMSSPDTWATIESARDLEQDDSQPLPSSDPYFPVAPAPRETWRSVGDSWPLEGWGPPKGW